MWLVPMLLSRQPAVGAGVALHRKNSARSLAAAAAALAGGATCTASQQPQLQAADMVASAATEKVAAVQSRQPAESSNWGSRNNTGKVFYAAAALNMQAVAAQQGAAEHTYCQLQQEQQHLRSVAVSPQLAQQQQHSGAQPAGVQAYHTQLLAIQPAELPPAESPAAHLVQQLLSSSAVPELSREVCPHLYYTLPEQFTQQLPHAGCEVAEGLGSTSSSSSSSAAALHQAAALLQAGLPVAVPTETVYGLAGNALSGAAVASIFAAKGRPADNPLIVHVSDLDMLAALYPEVQERPPGSNSSSSQGGSSAKSRSIADIIPQQYHRLIAAFWPGPLTILLPASPLLPAAVTAGQPTVAVRMPAHPVARALIAAAGVPLAAPSANSSGRPSPTSAQHVLDDLAGRVPAVVDGGGCGFGVESTVLDALRVPPVVLRPGGVTAEELAAAPEMSGLQVYARDFRDSALEAAPTTPGMKYRHYSPSAPVLLLDPAQAWQRQQQQQEQGQQQQGSALLQQLVSTATQELLDRVQQGQVQELAAGRAGGIAQRLVLLSTCSASNSRRASRSTGGLQQELAVGWTADSLALLQAQELQQQQSQQCDAAVVAGLAGSSSADRDGCCNGSSSADAASHEVEVLEFVLGSWQQPELVAQQLFGALRAADQAGAGLIVVQGLPPVGAGLAVMNRLLKAASTRDDIDHQHGSADSMPANVNWGAQTLCSVA